MRNLIEGGRLRERRRAVWGAIRSAVGDRRCPTTIQRVDVDIAVIVDVVLNETKRPGARVVTGACCPPGTVHDHRIRLEHR